MERTWEPKVDNEQKHNISINNKTLEKFFRTFARIDFLSLQSIIKILQEGKNS